MKIPDITVMSLLMLGLPDNSRPNKEDINKAYRKSSLVCHPDIGGSPEMFRALTIAKDFLIDSLHEIIQTPPVYNPQPRYNQPPPRPSHKQYKKQNWEEDIKW